MRVRFSIVERRRRVNQWSYVYVKDELTHTPSGFRIFFLFAKTVYAFRAGRICLQILKNRSFHDAEVKGNQPSPMVNVAFF